MKEKKQKLQMSQDQNMKYTNFSDVTSGIQ